MIKQDLELISGLIEGYDHIGTGSSKYAERDAKEADAAMQRIVTTFKRMEERSVVVLIGDTGHYVSQAVADHIALQDAKLATADALVTCCCGNPMTHSGYEGHSPVSQYHWHMRQLEERYAALRALLIRAEFELAHSERTGDVDHKLIPDLREALK